MGNTSPVDAAPTTETAAAHPRRGPARALLAAMRPHQWIKNLLVFGVPAAAGQLADPDVLADAALTFVAFCLASGGTYLLNDVADREADRLHPFKRHRPIAAGELSAGAATATAAGRSCWPARSPAAGPACCSSSPPTSC